MASRVHLAAILLALSAGPGLAEEFPPPDLTGASPFWIKDPRSGCVAGNPFPQEGERIEWSGACVDGLVSGPGTLTWYRNGRIAGRDEGDFAEGILAGSGRIMSVDGSSFEGEFPGSGIVTTPDGRRIPAQTAREPSGWSIEALDGTPAF